MERQGAAQASRRPVLDPASDPARSSRPMSTSEEWKDTGIWTVSQPGFGELHTVASDPEESGEHGLTSWQTPGGYTAQVERASPSAVVGNVRPTRPGPSRPHCAHRSPLSHCPGGSPNAVSPIPTTRDRASKVTRTRCPRGHR